MKSQGIDLVHASIPIGEIHLLGAKNYIEKGVNFDLLKSQLLRFIFWAPWTFEPNPMIIHLTGGERKEDHKCKYDSSSGEH